MVEAEWLKPRVRSPGSGVAAIVPDGFPAYVRILHPGRGTDDRPVRWAEVAARSGRTMHRLADFHALAGTTPFPSGIGDIPWIKSPQQGNLPADLLTALIAILAGHTTTTASCWFCLWDGYGWIHGSPAVSTFSFGAPGHAAPGENDPPVPPALPVEVLRGPRVHLPYRDYLLFSGALDAATEMGERLPWGEFRPQSPNLFWPQDHAWCVASEIDFYCTLVGGSEVLADALLADSRLEVWRVFPGDPVS